MYLILFEAGFVHTHDTLTHTQDHITEYKGPCTNVVPCSTHTTFIFNLTFTN